MTSLTLLRGCPRCQWLLSWMNNAHFSGSLPLLGVPLHRLKVFTTGHGARLSCCGSLVRAVFDASHFLTSERGTKTNMCVRHMYKHVQVRPPHGPQWGFMFSFLLLLYQGRTAPKWGWGIREVIHSPHTHAHTHGPFIFTLTGFSCSVSLAEEKDVVKEGGRVGGKISGKGWEEQGWRDKEVASKWSHFSYSMQTPLCLSWSPPYGYRVTGCECSLCFCSLSSPFHPFFSSPNLVYL